MDVATLLLAEGVSVDVFTGRLTAFNLVETLFAQKFPARVTRLHAIVQYEVDGNDVARHFFERLELLDPSGADVLHAPVQELTLTTRSHTSLHHAWNIVLPAGGDFILRVSTGETPAGPWVELRKRRVVVEQAPHPLLPQEPPKPAP